MYVHLRMYLLNFGQSGLPSCFIGCHSSSFRLLMESIQSNPAKFRVGWPLSQPYLRTVRAELNHFPFPVTHCGLPSSPVNYISPAQPISLPYKVPATLLNVAENLLGTPIWFFYSPNLKSQISNLRQRATSPLLSFSKRLCIPLSGRLDFNFARSKRRFIRIPILPTLPLERRRILNT